MTPQRSGDAESGFAIAAGEGPQAVRAEVWGFWDDTLAARFVRSMAEVFAPSRLGIKLVVNASRFKPQRQQGQEAMRALVVAAGRCAGASVTVVVSNPITRMQLARIFGDAENVSWALVEDEPKGAKTVKSP